MRSQRNGKELTVFLQGEVDHCAAERLRTDIERQIRMRETKRLVFDFTDVTFMDSSGIGMLIGRYKTMLDLGGETRATGFSTPIERLFRMAGLHRIIPITSGERRKEA